MVMQVSALVVGAGNRGGDYAKFAIEQPEQLKIAGVADPIKIRRTNFQKKYNIQQEYVFSDWKEAAAKKKFADCVIITAPDQLHKDPAIAFAAQGYHILLEKPMAVTLEDCLDIVKACKENQVILALGHVLRYGLHCRKIKQIIDSGEIGDIMNIQHTEQIGYWHFAHSYVRGNWRRQDTSTFSLLAKCCHDIDLLCHWIGRDCEKVSSFGSLLHFTQDNKPKGAASRCLDCPVEARCPYSAKKIYLDSAKVGDFGWPVSVVSDVPDIESVMKALRTGPYGRCVYNCDNDVVSNQVVNMQFAGGVTASLTMVACTEKVCVREVKVHGTKGEIICSFDQGALRVSNFSTGEATTRRLEEDDPMACRFGHGGTDYHLMTNFVKAVRAQDKACILSGPDEALPSYLIAFAAEKSRLENSVVVMKDFRQSSTTKQSRSTTKSCKLQ